MLRVIQRRLTELEARSGLSSSLFDLDNKDLHMDQVVSASIKSVKTIASGEWMIKKVRQ